jgi:hypothetical protein
MDKQLTTQRDYTAEELTNLLNKDRELQGIAVPKGYRYSLQELTNKLAEEQAKQGIGLTEEGAEKLMNVGSDLIKQSSEVQQAEETLEKPFNPNERFENNEYIQPKKVIVKMSKPELGLGVFATEDIKVGELIERCPMIQMTWRSRYLNDPTITKYMYSDSGCKCEHCKIHGHHMFMVLGYGMIYNHQDDPNTEWRFNYNNLLADVVAIKPINMGDEIFVHYGSNYFNNREYFDVKDVKK